MPVRQFISGFAFYFAVCFCCLNILFFPVDYYVFPNLGAELQEVISPLIQWFGSNIFGIEGAFTAELKSDSKGLYVFVGIITIFSAVVAIFISLFQRGIINRKATLWFFTVMAYYLALTLFKYGSHKIFKGQFYLPEPNTLYTPLGQLTPDITFWSAMGSSYSYTVFSGIIEIIPACLLLFRKTRLLGILISIAVLTNVVMINFGFDITVKVYSLFLLFVSLLLLVPYGRPLYQFFITRQPAAQSDEGFVINSRGTLIGYTITKTLVIGLVLIESFGIYFATGNFNDDNAARPPLHGAYEVYLFTDNGVIIPASMSHPGRFKRVFFHRSGYFIVQTMDDHFIDYQVLVDEVGKTITLYNSGWPAHRGYEATLAYRYENNELAIFGFFFDSNITLYAKKLDIENLPLLSEGFHWTIDDF